jgi:hypothetical protein
MTHEINEKSIQELDQKRKKPPAERPWHRREDDVKMDLSKIVCDMDCIQLVKDRVQ